MPSARSSSSAAAPPAGWPPPPSRRCSTTARVEIDARRIRRDRHGRRRRGDHPAAHRFNNMVGINEDEFLAATPGHLQARDRVRRLGRARRALFPSVRTARRRTLHGVHFHQLYLREAQAAAAAGHPRMVDERAAAASSAASRGPARRAPAAVAARLRLSLRRRPLCALPARATPSSNGVQPHRRQDRRRDAATARAATSTR